MAIVQAGKMWVQDEDTYFKMVFTKTGDKFDASDLLYAMTLVSDFSLAVDVGAHYGSWTRMLATKFDRVIAVEGSTQNFECLVRNTSHLDNVELVNKAVGDKKGSVDIGFEPTNPRPGTNSGGASVVGSGNIPMVTIDSLDWPKIGLLKFDIEGYEVFAMRGGLKTILKYKPVIVIEDNVRNEQYGFKTGDNVNFLKEQGATLIKTFPKSDNYVFIWT